MVDMDFGLVMQEIVEAEEASMHKQLQPITVVLKGGPGSGHHSHSGRPGKRGGSLPDKAFNGGTAPSTEFLKGLEDVYGTVVNEELGVNALYEYRLDARYLAEGGIYDRGTNARRVIRAGVLDDKKAYDLLNKNFTDTHVTTFLEDADRPLDSPFSMFPKGFGDEMMVDDGGSIEAEFADGRRITVEYYEGALAEANLADYRFSAPYRVFVNDFVKPGQRLDAERPWFTTQQQAYRYAMDKYLEWYPGGQAQLVDINWETADMKVRGSIKDELISALSLQSGIEYANVNDMIGQWATSSNGDEYASLSLQEAVHDEFGVQMSDWQSKSWDNVRIKRDNLAAERAIQDKYYDEANEFYNSHMSKMPEGVTIDTWKNNVYRYWRESHPDAPNALYDILQSGDYDMPDKWVSLSDRPTERKFLRTMYDNTQSWLSQNGYKPDDTIRLFRGVGRSAGTITVYDIGETVTYKGNAMESWSVSTKVAAGFGDYMLAMDVPVRNILSTARTGFGCFTEGEVVVMGNYNSEALVVYSTLTS